jgi:hypothetical protein
MIQLLQGNDYMGALTSGRDGNVTVFIAGLSHWELPNWLLGGYYEGTEMDFFDVFSHFGIVGTFLFAYGISLILRHIRNSLRWCFVFFFLILAAFSGHAFGDPANMTYLCLFAIRAREAQKNANEACI